MKNYSLRKKTVLLISFFALILVTVVVSVGYYLYTNASNEKYMKAAHCLAKTVTLDLDGDSIENYISRIDKGENPEEIKDDKYYEMLKKIQDVQECNGVTFLYVVDVRENDVVYILDADKTEKAIPFGTVEAPKEDDKDFLNQKQYEEIGFNRVSEKYGWMCSSGEPIYNSQNQIVAYTITDIAMTDIEIDRAFFLFKLSLILLVLTIIIIVISMRTIEESVIGPINKLSEATLKFVSNKNDSNQDSPIAGLKIKTGDEIENLCMSIKTMEKEINAYIEHLKQATAEKERIDAELSVATTIQGCMLPTNFVQYTGQQKIDMFATMKPAKEVGGDFYDYYYVDEDHLAITIADVSGKGVPAALFMVITKILIKTFLLSGFSPTECLERVNKQLCEANEADMFVTAWLGVLELSTGKLSYVNAGHNPPLVRGMQGKFDYLRTRSGLVLAGLENSKYKPLQYVLDDGDMLFLYTDGITEAINIKEQMYGEDRLKNILQQNADNSCTQIINAVSKDVNCFVGDCQQFDDMTMLAVKMPGEYKEIVVSTEIESITEVTVFVDEILQKNNCPVKEQRKINIVIDELFSNIVLYSKSTSATVGCSVVENRVSLRFIDSGIEYDPTLAKAPDTTLSAKDREIGGLGIYMAKKLTDSLQYRYINGNNITIITKKL